MVHPDSQSLQEVTFYVASNNSSVVLSCVTMLALSLIQPHTSLDYLPHCTSLITSTADHPMKTKSQMNVQVPKPISTVCTESNQQGRRPKLITSNGNDKHTYVSKRQATVSSQPGIRPSTEHKHTFQDRKL